MAEPDNLTPPLTPFSGSPPERQAPDVAFPRPGAALLDRGDDDDFDAEGERPRRKVRSSAKRSSQPVLFGQTADQLGVLLIAALAAVSGALASGQPTGSGPVDVVVRATFAFAIAFVV